MKLHGSDVVEVAQEREEAAPELVVPHFNLVIISARDNEWLDFVEVNAANWTVVLVEALQQNTHAAARGEHSVRQPKRARTRSAGVSKRGGTVITALPPGGLGGIIWKPMRPGAASDSECFFQ